MDLYIIILICVAAPLVNTYDQKFDMIDIEAIVNNDFVHRAVNVCILGEINCGPYWDEVIGKVLVQLHYKRSIIN